MLAVTGEEAGNKRHLKMAKKQEEKANSIFDGIKQCKISSGDFLGDKQSHYEHVQNTQTEKDEDENDPDITNMDIGILQTQTIIDYHL